MTITATSLVAPKGRINLDVGWPGLPEDTARGYVGEYLAQGLDADHADGGEAAAEQWAYYRYFDMVYLRLSGKPATAQANDEGSRTYTQAQIDAWRLLADEALAAYEDLVDEAAGGEPGEYEAITSER